MLTKSLLEEKKTCWRQEAFGLRTGLLQHALAWFRSSLTTLRAGTERRWICLPQAHHLRCLVWQPWCECMSMCACVVCLMRCIKVVFIGANWHCGPGVLHSDWNVCKWAPHPTLHPTQSEAHMNRIWSDSIKILINSFKKKFSIPRVLWNIFW